MRRIHVLHEAAEHQQAQTAAIPDPGHVTTPRTLLHCTLFPTGQRECFNFSRADVRRECTISARIAAEVRAGRCACEVKNPSGACCLGEVNRAVRDAKDALSKVRPGELAPSVRAAGTK